MNENITELQKRRADNIIWNCAKDYSFSPDFIVKIRKDERDIGVSYDEIRALTDTAHEVRRLRAEGVSVMCIFTGEDKDLPSAKMVYGHDLVRIRDFSYFADAVGKLILDQIKSFSMQ